MSRFTEKDDPGLAAGRGKWPGQGRLPGREISVGTCYRWKPKFGGFVRTRVEKLAGNPWLDQVRLHKHRLALTLTKAFAPIL